MGIYCNIAITNGCALVDALVMFFVSLFPIFRQEGVLAIIA